MKIAIRTFGCKLNQYEGEVIRKILSRYADEIVPFKSPADYYIINGCAVTKRAEQKAFQFIRGIRKKYPAAKVVLTGCLGSLVAEGIIEDPRIDYILANEDKFKVAETLNKIGKETITEGQQSAWYDITDFANHTRAFVKIQDGCDNRCAYCIVPLIRGNSRSRPPEEIIEQANILTYNGFKEVVLTGVNIGSYFYVESGKKTKLEDLLQALLETTEIPRIRLSSIEIDEVTDGLIKVIATSENRVVHHLHVPLQSGSDEILRKMGRKYTAAEYTTGIESIRESLPDVMLGADVIVGFPGETEQNFKGTYDLIEILQIHHLHVFKYSPRPGVASEKLSGNIPGGVKSVRSRLLYALGWRNKERFVGSFVGKRLKVLFEKEIEPGVWRGFSGNFINCFVNCQDNLRNQLWEVRGHKISGDHLKVTLEKLRY